MTDPVPVLYHVVLQPTHPVVVDSAYHSPPIPQPHLEPDVHTDLVEQAEPDVDVLRNVLREAGVP